MQAPSSGKTVVIVAYKPKPGKEADLLQLTREHVPLLRAEGLATDHPVTACQAKDGTVVEVFEWAPGGVERAHSNPFAELPFPWASKSSASCHFFSKKTKHLDR